MKYRPLGSTGLLVSEVGFGAWQLGGEGWGRTDARETLDAVRAALDLGINLFDTAPVYGFGRSEELLGRALGGAHVSIVSKCGLAWDERKRVTHDARPEVLRRGLDDSLRRLRREELDVLLLHWPDPAVPLRESLGALEALRRKGKIRAWGLANFPANMVRSVDSIVSGGLRGEAGPVLEYPRNILRTYADEYRESGAAGEELLEVAAHAGWGFLAFDVLLRGLLGGRYTRETRFGKRDLRSRDSRYEGEAFERCLCRAEKLSSAARALGVPPAALAISAILRDPGVTSCLVGIRNPSQAKECAEASRVAAGPLPDGL